MSLRGEELVIDGQTMDVNISSSLTGARLVRDYEGTTRLELSIYDPLMNLMRSGVLTRAGKPSARQKQFSGAAWDRFTAARLNLDGISFRLAGASFSYSFETRETMVIFEDELATLLRLRTESMKVSRGADTRAEFIGRLVSTAVKRGNLPFTSKGRYFSPQAGQKQPIAEPDDEERKRGITKTSKVTVKGKFADAEQRGNMETVLTVAAALSAGERPTLALLVACITESLFRNLPSGDRDSEGILQVRRSTAVGITPRTAVDPRTGLVHGGVTRKDDAGKIAAGKLDPRDIKAVCREFLLRGFCGKGGAIKIADDEPDLEIQEIAQRVQGSGTLDGSNYAPWVDEAKTILAAWGGAGSTNAIKESFEFRAGGRRNGQSSNWWDDSGDLAAKVRWRRFADRNRVWFVSDEWLFERSPTIVIDGEKGPAGLSAQGIISLDTSQVDVGLPTSEIRIKCFLIRWAGAPGAVVLLENLGPLDGRWLIGTNDQDLMQPTEISTLTLVRPAPKKKEPATTTRATTVGTDVDGAVPGSPVPGQEPQASTHQTAGLPGYPAFDYMAPAGTPCVAPAAGKIARLSGRDPSQGGSPGGPLGYSIYLDGSNGKSYFMTHLDKVRVTVGQRVAQGEQIAEVANGPASWSSPHVHMGVRG